jgi:hypothetical protein
MTRRGRAAYRFSQTANALGVQSSQASAKCAASLGRDPTRSTAVAGQLARMLAHLVKMWLRMRRDSLL